MHNETYPPKKITFWISVLLGVIALVGAILEIPFLTAFAFWVLFVGFVLLVLALLIKGL